MSTTRFLMLHIVGQLVDTDQYVVSIREAFSPSVLPNANFFIFNSIKLLELKVLTENITQRYS